LKETKYYVYVLELCDGRKYIGQTNNLERRIEEHRSGRSRFTRKYGVKRILYSESYTTRSEAMHREKYLKSSTGRAWLKKKLAEQSV